MREVAAASGVSQATVSHVLNGNGVTYRIAQKTQARVRDAADRLGYRRNQSARSMRMGRFMAIGFVANAEGNYYGFARQPRLVRGLASGCNTHGCYLRLVTFEPDGREPEQYLKTTFRELGVDGLVVAESTRLGGPLENAIEKFRIPTLWANELRDHDCVIPDEPQGVREVLDEFRRLGHHRIAYIDRGIDGAWSHFSDAHRRGAFEAYVRESGIDGRITVVDDEVHACTRQMIHLLQQPDRPTACLVRGGERAQTLLWAAREAGVDVPRDLSIVALDDHYYMNVGLKLTFKRIPVREVGEIAGSLIQQKVARPGQQFPPRLVPYGELKAGESLATAPTP